MPNGKLDAGPKKEAGHCMCCHGNGSFVKKIMLTLIGVLLVYVIFYFGTVIRNNIRQYVFIGKADQMERTITVNGYGKVTGNNDIAVTTIGYSNTDKDVAKAQADNKKVMDQVFADLKGMGIAEKDMTTDYSIYPDYNYTQDKGQMLNGYKVTNSITIKIRDLSKISDVLSLAGKYGATEVSGLSFTIDDPENLKALARDKALADAKAKAVHLAQTLGVQVTAVVSYSEYEGSPTNYYAVDSTMKSLAASAEGGGGAPAAVSAGSKDEIMNVAVTYEIAP